MRLIWLTVCLALVISSLDVKAARQTRRLASPVMQTPLNPMLGSPASHAIPYVQPGCTVMYSPEQPCLLQPSPYVSGCCTPGYSCDIDGNSTSGYSCKPVPIQQLQYDYEAAVKGSCNMTVSVGGQCGGAGYDCYKYEVCDQFGPWQGFCCPNGYSCKPLDQEYRMWTCALNVQDQPPVLDLAQETLQYPPRPMPPDSCTCRVDMNRTRIPMDCPSPWSTPAGTNMVPPALQIAPGGVLMEEGTGKPAVLRGINWFGWHVGSFNFDGLWAYCDDNSTASDPPCPQDGEIPPWQYPSEAIGAEAQEKLGFGFWGKRRMTNDFAGVVYRMKLLGFNAVRVQFKFSDLNQNIPQPANGDPEFFPCLLDSDTYIAAAKTLDPQLIQGLGAQYSLAALRPFVPKYTGIQHPPPKNGDPRCDLPWSAPFLSNYTGGQGKRLRLTMCNWYLPQGPGMPALYRFLWQVQYLVSQGLYVLLDFSSTRDTEPNMSDPSLLAKNWGNFWRILADIPIYKEALRGRVFPDLVNEPSRWGCQWTSSCVDAQGSVGCAPVLQSFGRAAAAIWEVDPEVPIFVNGLGQDLTYKWAHCGRAYPGMHWGDGFITNRQAVERWNISSPSDMFTTALTDWVGNVVRVERGEPQMPRWVLSPHIYPSSVTGAVDEIQATLETITYRWDLSWGFKMQGVDTTLQGARIPAMPVVIGESGARDSGDNSINNTDTTYYDPADRAWLDVVASYLRTLSERTGRQPSFFFWALNANSGDTKGIFGPRTTWREVQWTKVRLLVRNFGLQPWYCHWWPEFCETLNW